jgi:hypothetical protein
MRLLFLIWDLSYNWEIMCFIIISVYDVLNI